MSQEIEDIVKQTFESFEADVNPQVWTNIQQGLQFTPPAPTEPAHVATVAKTAGIAGKLSAILTVSSITVITAFVTWYYAGDQADQKINEPSAVVSTSSISNNDQNTNTNIQQEPSTADQSVNKSAGVAEPLTADKNVVSNTEKATNQSAETTNSNAGPKPDQPKDQSSTAGNTDPKLKTNDGNDKVKVTKDPPAGPEEKTTAEAKDLIEKFNEQPAAYILANPVVGNAPLTVNFLNNGYAKSVKWNFDDGTSIQQEQTTHIFKQPGSYEVTLTATDANGKVFTDKVTIDVKGDENSNSSSVAEIQNVFTPNGDGYNDVFRVNGKNLASLHGEIYSIAGKRVFQWSNPEDGWDGTLSNGSTAREDSYFYIIEVTGKDGQEYLFKGSVRLIK